jgi:RNA-directed DNA polymerase
LDAVSLLEPTLVSDSVATVNGPEGESLDWDAVRWRTVEDDVRRLRQRIFAASQAGDLKRVRSLQKLMLRSRSNALLSVRRITEVNQGRKTAGVDGMVVMDAQDKADLAAWIQRQAKPWSPRPVKRVYVAKSNGRRRPLGIPVIADRCLQALAASALEPEWEARFEPRSYGFRPGRGCHDAIVAAHTISSGRNATRSWVLDADLQEAFDRLGHDHIMDSLGTFPSRGLIRQWLTAGVIEDGRWTATEEGVPQGGPISPLLMNVALHGMEQAAGVRHYRSHDGVTYLARKSPALVRYADDLLALCHSREQAEQVKAQLAAWLARRGLAFNETKTRITHLDQGVDFLGFNIRRFRGKLLTKPSKDAVRRIRRRLSTEMRALRGSNADGVIGRLNPIITGWTAYYRTGASKETFNTLDTHVWELTWKWARYSHPNKSAGWLKNRYYGKFNSARQDKWVFGSHDTGYYLRRFAWTPIVRHRMVAGTSSPDDPALTKYWADRRRRSKPPLGNFLLRILQSQQGRCRICGDLLLHTEREPQSPTEWEQWYTATRKAIRKSAITNPTPGKLDDRAAHHLVHTHCHRKKLNGGKAATTPSASKPQGLA